jgi:hypothetical protein
MKGFIYILFLMMMTSCAFRTLEGRVKPVYFSADSSVFADTVLSSGQVLYPDLMGLTTCLQDVKLNLSETGQALISRPTIFRSEDREFLVYPGEHIVVTADESNFFMTTFNTASGNKVRDGELLVFKIFQDLEKKPNAPILLEYNYQAILDLEKEQKSKIASAERASQLLFDSLCNTYHASRKFRKLTKGYIQNRYDFTVLGVYNLYRDTLLARDVYRSKVMTLLPDVNRVTKISQFNSNVAGYASGLYISLFPKMGIRNMHNETEFQERFDSIVTYFSGPARDLLLSRAMFWAVEKHIAIPPSYRKQYRRYSMNKQYRKIITRARREQSKKINA